MALKATVQIGNFQFEPKDLAVSPGTTVEWTDIGGRHTVEAEDGSFKSNALTAGGKFEHRFERPGAFPYFCRFHGSGGGRDMAGTVTVK
jgi:plastocyanin